MRVIARRSIPAGLLVAAAALVLASCSGEVTLSFGGRSADDAAVDLIEGDLAVQLGLGPLEANCQAVEDPEVGDTFPCTAFTEAAETVRFAGVVEDEDSIEVTSENVILADALPVVEAAAVEALESATGMTLGVENFDCGDRSVIVDLGGTLDCVLTDPGNGDRYAATVTVNSREPLNIDVAVGEAPLG